MRALGVFLLFIFEHFYIDTIRASFRVCCCAMVVLSGQKVRPQTEANFPKIFSRGQQGKKKGKNEKQNKTSTLLFEIF